jgi:predicted glycosyltransferase
MQGKPPKILIVSNEILGLGHIRIALRLSAQIQAELTDVSVLLLTASPMAEAFQLPKGLDVIKIPIVARSEDSLKSVYRSVQLPLPFNEVKKLRQRIIWETAQTYRPDLLLVDYRPAGVDGELLPTLRALKRKRQATLVLLLRDILGDPNVVRARWQADQTMSALEEYDEIWVYGCQTIYDPIREYQFPDTIARKIRFCGYLDIEPLVVPGRDIRHTLGIADQLLVLVTIGNGRVGSSVLDAYLGALKQLPNDLDVFSLIVGGPELPPEQYEIIDQQCRVMSTECSRRRFYFVRFLPELLHYMGAADLVISLGGYNTVTEILRLEKRAIVVPYVPRSKEQLIRASLMERLGLVQTVHPDHLSPEILAKSILGALHTSPPTRQRLQELGFDFNGLQHMRGHVMRILGRAQPVGGKA